jgi:Domain of unknown function (DUF4431)
MAAFALAASLLALAFAPRLPQPACLRYQPNVVTLEGAVTRRMYAGPPTHESIPGGDRADTAVILVLPAPICVAPDSSSFEPDNVRESGVREVQLASGSDSVWAALKRVRGSRIRVTGELFHAITAHPRTPVLLWVVRVDAG